MPQRHDKFVRDQNIRMFEQRLTTEIDPHLRETLEELLRAEKAKKPPLANLPS